jgi:raffinose/stachyose/melibiose transport system substrate-binding protein
MKSLSSRLAIAAVTVGPLVALAACGGSSSSSSSGSASGSGAGAGKTTITLLVDNQDTTVKAAKAEIDAFQKANPDITVKMDTRPQGSDGDNIIKTKLSTGEMSDVFWYNSGSLLQALSPEKNLVDLTGDAALANVDPSYFPSVTQGGKVYGVPWGTAMGGGILYNKDVYAKLGLQVPKSWSEFEANNDKIKAAGITGSSQMRVWSGDRVAVPG